MSKRRETFTMFDYSAPSDLLKGKVILVTGASAGIGRAAAMAFGQRGADVVLCSSNTSRLEETYDLMLAGGCRTPSIYTFDLLCEEEQPYMDFALAIQEEYGRLDGLLHNASLLGEIKPIEQQTFSTWRDVQQVNVGAAYMLSKAMLPALKAADNASVVFTSSGVGRKGRAYWGAYSVSKFATEGLMQVLADELENTSSVRVNSVNPGATNTSMRRQAYPGEVPENNPAPEEIMPVYLYLMGNDSLGINGQALSAQKQQ